MFSDLNFDYISLLKLAIISLSKQAEGEVGVRFDRRRQVATGNNHH